MDDDQTIPYGYCHCGCGEKTRIATMTSTKYGRVKGQPGRYVHGHQGRAVHHPPLTERLWAKIDKRGPDECWPFMGCRDRAGYGRIGDGKGRSGETIGAHLAVAEETYGPRPEGMETRHLCGNPPCCNPRHLRFGTPAENNADRLAHGTLNRGENHGLHKLTRDQVLEIRKRCAAGGRQRTVAADYGICQQTVSEIVNGLIWGWLEGGDAA